LSLAEVVDELHVVVVVAGKTVDLNPAALVVVCFGSVVIAEFAAVVVVVVVVVDSEKLGRRNELKPSFREALLWNT
jgi:hypothetical protein